jgi:hypothetical protein
MKLTNLILRKIRTGFDGSYKLYKSRPAFLSAYFFSPHPLLLSCKIDPSGLFEKAMFQGRICVCIHTKISAPMGDNCLSSIEQGYLALPQRFFNSLFRMNLSLGEKREKVVN